MWQTVKQLAGQGTTVLLTTQQLEEAHRTKGTMWSYAFAIATYRRRIS